MNKKLIISLSTIIAVVATVIGGTVAYFNDTETSVGNTFTAGTIDLQVGSQCTYNGATSTQCGTWELKDLEPTVDKFFNFTDIKPGDAGENTISLRVINNDAWVCAEVSNLTNFENGQTEPEASVDVTTGTNEGELQEALIMTIWRDDGDNIQEDGEAVLASGYPVNGVLPVYDSTTGTGALLGGSTAYLGISWSLPAATGNEVQTDSMTGDISFNVVQSRNNESFRCGSKVFVKTYDSGGNDTNKQTLYNGYYLPHIDYQINGSCIEFNFINPTPFQFVFDYRVDNEAGEDHPWTNLTIGQGPLLGQLYGQKYNWVTLIGNTSQTVNVCGQDEIQVGLRVGAERMWYFDWIKFQAK